MLIEKRRQDSPVITPLTGTHVTATLPSVRNLKLPPRVLAGSSIAAKLEAVLGFLGLAIIALMAMFVVARQQELITLRKQIAQAMARKAQQAGLQTTYHDDREDR